MFLISSVQTMSLWKVLSKTPAQMVQQEVKTAAAGGFVWGKEGFKWTVGSGSDDDQSHPSVTKHDSVCDSSTNDGTAAMSPDMTPNILDGK